VKGSPDQHIIYGYLQIDQVITNAEPVPDYALNHPHANSFHRSKSLNAIFVSTENLSFFTNLTKSRNFTLFRKESPDSSRSDKKPLGLTGIFPGTEYFLPHTLFL
jgi:hypothetical protein